MTDFLADLLPIRRILVDGEATAFSRDVDFIGAQATVNSSTGATEFRFGLQVIDVVSGGTLRVDYLNILDDDSEGSPTFVLPAPSTWTGRRIVAKRLDQPASQVTITATGGALIDGSASYVLAGADACAEFYSDGTRVLVGPTTGAVAATPVIDTLPAASFHLAPWDPSTITTVSGAVDTATDKGGGSLVMSAATVGSRPLLNLTGVDTLNGNPSISTTFNQGSFNNGFRSLTGAPTGPVPQAMACVSKYRSFDGAALQTLVCAGAYDVGATSWGAWIGAGGAGADQHGGGYGRVCSTTQDADLLPHVHVTTFDGTIVRYYIDGFLVATATPAAYPGANSVDTRNGKIGFYQNAAGTSLADAAHFDAQWSVTHYSEAVIRKYSRQCAEKFGLWKIGLIYCNGDSITAGNTLADVNNAWPALLATSALVNGGAIQVINAGVGLRTMDQIATLSGIADSTNAAFSGQRRFAPNKIGNIEIIWAGTNDNYASSESAANIWADMQARANASIAKGYVPILGTMLRRAGGTGGQETVRTTVNTSIKNGPYRYFDLAEHPAFLSTASVAQSVVGFSDGIHPTDQANIDVIAPEIASVCNAAIAEESPT